MIKVNKVAKYDQLTGTHAFYPVAIETAGTWHHKAIGLVEEIGKCTPTSLEIHISVSAAVRGTSKGNAVSFQSTFAVAICYFLFYLMYFCLLGCLPGHKFIANITIYP